MLFHFEAYLDGHRVKYGQKHGVPVESFKARIEEREYPNQMGVIKQLDSLRLKIQPFVERIVKRALTGKRKKHNPMGRLEYVLRHTVVHIAYFRREMYRRGIPRPTY